jgi:hypothetical protein
VRRPTPSLVSTLTPKYETRNPNPESRNGAQGRYAEAEGAFTISIRLGASRPPIHTMSMLVSTCLSANKPVRAHTVYTSLLGHSPTAGVSMWGSGGGGLRSIPVEYGVLRVATGLDPRAGLHAQSGGEERGGRGGGGGGDGYGDERGAGDGYVNVRQFRSLLEAGMGPRGELERQVEEEIRANQFPVRCDGRALLLHSLGDRKSGWGMGSMLHELVVALSQALRLGRTLVLPRNDEWLSLPLPSTVCLFLFLYHSCLTVHSSRLARARSRG